MRVPRRLPQVLLVVLAALGLAAAGSVVYVGYAAADRLIHPPRDLDPRTPAWDGLAYDDVTFTTSDGIPLAGWWIPADAAPNATARPTVVFLHGYGASKAQSLSVDGFLHRAGYNVLAFDFRAHGQSGGSYTTVGLDEVEDVRAALGWLASAPPGSDPSEVALMGWSMGAATALNAAAHGIHVRALVLDSPFASLDVVAGRILTQSTGLPAQPFATVGFAWAQWMTHASVRDDRPVAEAPHVATPLLVIQGLSDTLAGGGGQAVSAAAGPNATLWLVPGAGHVDAVNEQPAEYQARVLSFLDRAFA